MFTTMKLENVAGVASREIALNPLGQTVLSQPTGWGKSTVTHALIVALCAEPINVTQDTDKTKAAATASVTVTTRRGTVMQVRAGKGAGYSTDGHALTRAEYLSRLGKWGGEAARYIVAPMAWTELAAGTAQPLRDLLARLLPAGDVPSRVRELMGEAWVEGMPCDVRGAEAYQTEARRAAAVAVGAVGAAEAAHRQAIALAQGTAMPSDADYQTARGRVRQAAHWAEFEALQAAYLAAVERHRRAEPKPPAYDAEAHAAARRAVEDWRPAPVEPAAAPPVSSEQWAAAVTEPSLLTVATLLDTGDLTLTETTELPNITTFRIVVDDPEQWPAKAKKCRVALVRALKEKA